MADAVTPTTKTPWHLWVVGIVSLLWNSMGALDFTATQMKSTAYLKALTPYQLAYFYGIPLWVVIAWGVGTWGSALGSLLLLLRRKLASTFFCASLIGAILTDVYTYCLSDGMKIMKGGAGMVVFSAIIFVIVALLAIYACAMKKRGVLR